MVAVIMMVTIVMVGTVESDPSDDYLKCYLNCALLCDDHDVDCLNLCKKKCSGIISHHGPGEPPLIISNELHVEWHMWMFTEGK
ncbi:unnamed protein product, partial [Brassica napus]